MNEEGIDAAAQLAALGLDPLKFLTTRDSFKRGLMMELARRIFKYRQMLDKNLADEITNSIGKAFFSK